MALDKPPLPNASPGLPITAQGWNAIVDGLSRLYDAVAAIGSGTLEVIVSTGGTPVDGALVSAVPAAGGNPLLAIPPSGGRTTYVVGGVSDGAWKIVVRATGYAEASVDINVPAAAPVAVDLTPVGPAVPDVFGQPLQTAFAALTTANLGVGLLLDALGKEVPRTPIPADYQNSPVLAQLPPAGTRLGPEGRVQLVVAATVTQAPVVTMPNLAGLTQTEVVRVLDQLGLTVGTIQVISNA